LKWKIKNNGLLVVGLCSRLEHNYDLVISGQFRLVKEYLNRNNIGRDMVWKGGSRNTSDSYNLYQFCSQWNSSTEIVAWTISTSPQFIRPAQSGPPAQLWPAYWRRKSQLDKWRIDWRTKKWEIQAYIYT
jgi:hypothetical protein